MIKNGKSYVKCEIAAGMYGVTKYVMIRDKGNKGDIIAAGFFPKELLKKNKLRVNVRVIKKNRALISVDKDSGGRFLSGLKVWVPKKLIVSR